LPQVSAAQELQTKAQIRLASLMEEKLVTRISVLSTLLDVGLDLAAVGKAHHPAAITLFDDDAAGSKTEIDRLECAAQDVEQVRAVHRQVGRAKLLAERAAVDAAATCGLRTRRDAALQPVCPGRSARVSQPNEKPENCYCSALPKGSGLCLPCYTRWLAGRRA